MGYRNHSGHAYRHQGYFFGDHQNNDKMRIEGREPDEANPGKQMGVSNDNPGVALPRGRGHPEGSV